MYAHSLKEQQIDTNRKIAYDILFASSSLSHINFHQDVNLFRSLMELTKLCNREHCTGGYNCKHGVCGNKKYHICIKDLEYGDCLGQNCDCVHLTKRGLKPFYIIDTVKQHVTKTLEQDITKTLEQDITKTLEQDITKTLEQDITKTLEQDITKTSEQDYDALLTAIFLKNQGKNLDDASMCDTISNISLDDDSVKTIDEYDESIFDEKIQ
jgi:hypothetical protein